MPEYEKMIIVKCPNCEAELEIKLKTTIDHKLELTE